MKSFKIRSLNASANLPSVPLSSAELSRRASAWLRKRGLIQPFRRTASVKLKEFKP